MRPPSRVKGFIEPGFEPIAEVFAANITRGDEHGAACAIYVQGKAVVDIWGGVADSSLGVAWDRETLVPVFSVTKGVAALCVLRLVDQGLIRLDAPVAEYWPEFSAQGKGRLTVREALAHRAGVPFIDGDISLEDLSDPAAMAARLASQAPIFEAGSSHLYHPITVGWISSELVRRLTGLPIGQWLQENIAVPLAIDMWMGLPVEKRKRIARLDVQVAEALPQAVAMAPPGSRTWKAISLNGLVSLLPGGAGVDFNDGRLQAVELAGCGLITNARSLAKFYASCLFPIDGPRLLTDGTIADASKLVSSGIQFEDTKTGPSWGAGLMVPWESQPMIGPRSFGHDGYFGNLAFADPDPGISFAYVRNTLMSGTIGTGKDKAVYAVVDALAETLR